MGAGTDPPTTASKVDANDDQKSFFGDDRDFSLRYDSSNDRFVLVDETNSTDIAYFNKNGNIELANGDLVDGASNIVYNQTNNHVPRGSQEKAHATETASPSNGASVAPSAGTELFIVNPDGTNTVNPDNVATQGRRVVIVHNGGANTPTISFDSADFVGNTPTNMSTAGDTTEIMNTDGSTSGWVNVSEERA